MCTALFIPGKDLFTFVSLRDENPARKPAIPPQINKETEHSTLFPKDPTGGGTWIGANSMGTLIILLNGGFECHVRQPSYGRSRGLIVTELLAATDALTSWKNTDLSNIEPHTLVLWQHNKLYQLTWDGIKNHVEEKDSRVAYIWSSSTLYDEKAKNQRSSTFQSWLEDVKVVDRQNLHDFFTSSTDTWNGFVINRNEVVKTLCMSYLTASPSKISFQYHDFTAGVITEKNIKTSQFE